MATAINETGFEMQPSTDGWSRWFLRAGAMWLRFGLRAAR